MSPLGKLLLILAGAPSVLFYWFVTTFGAHINPLLWLGLLVIIAAACGRRPGVKKNDN